MKTIEQVQIQLLLGQFDLTRHAQMRVVERNISRSDIEQSGADSVIIEEYVEDKYSPSCLLLGFTQDRRPLHIQVSLADTDLVRVITVYEPDPQLWHNHSVRKGDYV